MCFYKYELSGMTILHNVICVEWLKIGNCTNIKVGQNFVVTKKFMSQHCLSCDIISLSHDTLFKREQTLR